MLQLTAEEKADLQKRAGDKGHEYYSCCPICGNLRWRYTQTDQPPDATVSEDHSSSECSRCEEAFQRAPEVVRWVLAVLGYQDRKRRADGQKTSDRQT